MGEYKVCISHSKLYGILTMSFTFNIHAENLPVMDKGLEGSSCDPYFKLLINGSQVYKSQSIKNTLNPVWPEFTLERDALGSAPKLQDIKLQVFDKDWGNKDDHVGCVDFKIINHVGEIRGKTELNLVNS